MLKHTPLPAMSPTRGKGAMRIGAALLLCIAANGADALDIKESGAPEERLFGSWGLLCFDRKPRVCTLSQAVSTEPRGTQVVLGVAVHVDPGSTRPKISFRMSQLALPSAGLGLKIDQAAEYRLPMSTCDERVCLASGWLNGGLRTALENGTVAQVAFLMQDRKQVLVPLSLKGFKEGVQELVRSTASSPSAVRQTPARPAVR